MRNLRTALKLAVRQGQKGNIGVHFSVPTDDVTEEARPGLRRGKGQTAIATAEQSQNRLTCGSARSMQMIRASDLRRGMAKIGAACREPAPFVKKK